MSNARARAVAMGGALLLVSFGGLVGCASGLPELPTATANGPKYSELVSNIECELATVVNQPLLEAGSLNARLARRLELLHDPKKADELLRDLSAFNFVASVQLSLEVTDNEGASPSLSFINTPQIFTFGIGGQWSGTQDRTTSAAYPIDLRHLLIDTSNGKAISLQEMEDILVKQKNICTRDELHRLSTGEFKAASESASAPSSGSGSGLAGDLGLADILVDGMTALDAAARNNVYSTLGPALISPSASFRHAVDLESLDGTGHVLPLSGKDNSKVRFPTDGSEFEGILQLAPQAPGAQGSATLLGKFTVAYEKPGKMPGRAVFLANLSGATMSPEATDQDPLYFSLTGNLLPAPGDADAQSLYHNYGFDSSVTLVGSVMLTGGQYHFPGLKLEGSLSPPSGTASAASGASSEIHLKFSGEPQIRIPRFAANALTYQYVAPEAFSGKNGVKPPASPTATPTGGGAGGGGGKAAAAGQGASGGTTFGSLVDFVVVYGVNGGPNWTYKRFHGPVAAGGSLLSYTKTKTDSLTISFAATCQDNGPLVVTASKYWESLPVCDALGSLKASSQALASQNNSLLIFRNTLQQR
jgi:hypothetical protein